MSDDGEPAANPINYEQKIVGVFTGVEINGDFQVFPIGWFHPSELPADPPPGEIFALEGGSLIRHNATKLTRDYFSQFLGSPWVPT